MSFSPLQDFEQAEDRHSDYLKNLFFMYVDFCVAVDELSAEVR